jgi:hypothetical protein
MWSFSPSNVVQAQMAPRPSQRNGDWDISRAGFNTSSIMIGNAPSIMQREAPAITGG